MKAWWAVAGVAGWVVAYMAGVAIGDAIAARAQEKPAHTTRQWLATVIKQDWSPDIRVIVVDTEGVCLYVTGNGDHGASIAAVAKTLLPKGAGCQ